VSEAVPSPELVTPAELKVMTFVKVIGAPKELPAKTKINSAVTIKIFLI
jgi:hypothetical protein